MVAKNQPSIVTTQQPASGAIGDPFKDKATLSGGVNYAGTGTINFKLYSAAGCGGSGWTTRTWAALRRTGLPDAERVRDPERRHVLLGRVVQRGCEQQVVHEWLGNDEPVVVAKSQPSIVTTRLRPGRDR